jgi:hypothetical protein
MMATTEERMKILKMIEEEKITAEEGAKLLSLLSSGKKAKPSAHGRVAAPRWLRVRVTDVNTGRSKATVQIPLSLVDAGMKIGAHFAPELEGMEMDNVMDAFQRGMTGKIVDVVDEEDGEHVEIFIE